jgi:hypothetical protein
MQHILGHSLGVSVVRDRPQGRASAAVSEMSGTELSPKAPEDLRSETGGPRAEPLDKTPMTYSAEPFNVPGLYQLVLVKQEDQALTFVRSPLDIDFSNSMWELLEADTVIADDAPYS